MKDHVYVFLADGFEDIEALTVVDLLRRAKIPVTTVAIGAERQVETSHGITLFADALFSDCDFSNAALLVLPGGQPGTTNLGNFAPLTELLTDFAAEGRRIAAICAAPSVLNKLGILEGKRATSYPAVQPAMDRVGSYETDSVVVDGFVTTSRGLGTAIDFSLSLIAQLRSQEEADAIAKSVVYVREE